MSVAFPFSTIPLITFNFDQTVLTCNPDSLLNFISQMLHRYKSSDDRHTKEPSELLDIPAYRDPSVISMSGYAAGPSSVRAGLTVSGLCSHFIFIFIPEWIKYKVKLNTASKQR